MGLDLRVYATLQATAIDNAGNQIKSVLIEEFYDCWNFNSEETQKIIDSENKIEQYRESLRFECDLYDFDFDISLIRFNSFIEQYKNWNIVFEGI